MEGMPPPEHTVRPSDRRCDVEDCDGQVILMLQRRRSDGGLVEARFCEQHSFDMRVQARTIEAADLVKIPPSDDIVVMPDIETTPGGSGR